METAEKEQILYGKIRKNKTTALFFSHANALSHASYWELHKSLSSTSARELTYSLSCRSKLPSESDASFCQISIKVPLSEKGVLGGQHGSTQILKMVKQKNQPLTLWFDAEDPTPTCSVVPKLVTTSQVPKSDMFSGLPG